MIELKYTYIKKKNRAHHSRKLKMFFIENILFLRRNKRSPLFFNFQNSIIFPN
jgi:hypothetical protein